MFPFTVENRLDELADECQRANAVAYIIGKMIVIMEFHARTIHHQTVWLPRQFTAYTISDPNAAFPGVFAAPLHEDRRKYPQYLVRGAGITADGVAFDPQRHLISKHYAVTTSEIDHWYVGDGNPFWQQDVLKDLRLHFTKMPPQPEVTECIAIVDKLIAQLYPSPPYSFSANSDPRFNIYTMRQLPVSGKIASHARPAVVTKDETLLHIINCCEVVQNTSYLQFVHDRTNVSFAKVGAWRIEELEYFTVDHALPGIFWIQRTPSANALELDHAGFGLSFSDKTSEAITRQRTLGMLKRCARNVSSRQSRDISMTEIFPCLGELPTLFNDLETVLKKPDTEGAQFLSRIRSAIESSKRVLERTAAGKQSRLLSAPNMTVWTLKSTIEAKPTKAKK